MALKDFVSSRTGAEVDPAAPAAPAQPRAAVVARPARTVSPSTSIDATTELVGNLTCRETLRIDGKIEGEIRCERDVIVGEGAIVHAAIHAAEVSVAGEVQGDIQASRKITLEETARVVGDLKTPGIVIQEGATLEGRIMIGERGATAQPEQTAGTKAPEADARTRRPQRSSTRPPPPPSPSV